MCRFAQGEGREIKPNGRNREGEERFIAAASER